MREINSGNNSNINLCLSNGLHQRFGTKQDVLLNSNVSIHAMGERDDPRPAEMENVF